MYTKKTMNRHELNKADPIGEASVTPVVRNVPDQIPRKTIWTLNPEPNWAWNLIAISLQGKLCKLKKISFKQ